MVDEKALDLEFNRKKKQTVSGHVEPVVSLPNTEWEIKTLCGSKWVYKKGMTLIEVLCSIHNEYGDSKEVISAINLAH